MRRPDAHDPSPAAIALSAPGISDEAVRYAALEAPRRAFVPMPGLRVIERPGWLQLVMPALRAGGLNGVAHSVLTDDQADAVIDTTIAEYAQLGVVFRWRLDPDSRPLDLAARLALRGLRRSDGLAMVRTTTDVAALASPAEISVEPVTSATVEVYGRLHAAAWGVEAGPLHAYHRALLATPTPRSGLYLARWRGQPAAAAAEMHFAGSAYLIGGVVLPAYRGRGLYRALVTARLRSAAAAGLPLVTTHALAATSAPILARLGFAALCATTSFTNQGPS